MAIKVPTPVTSGPQPLGGEPYTPVQAGYFNLSYPTPPKKSYQGMAIQGGQLADLGGAISSFASKWQDEIDANGLLQIENNLYDLERRLYDPATGIGQQFGSNAFGMSKAVQSVLDDFMAENQMPGLSMAGRRAAERLILGRSGQIMGQVENYELKQRVTHNTELLQANIEQQIDRAAASGAEFGDATFDAAMSNIDGQIDALGDYLGWSPEKRDQEKQIATTAAIIGRVNAIATGTLTQSADAEKAIAYLQDGMQSGLVDAETFNEAMATLKPIWINQQGALEAAQAGIDDLNEQWGILYGSTYQQPTWQGHDPNTPVSITTVAESAKAEAQQSEADAIRQQQAMVAQGVAARRPGTIVSPNGTVATGPMPQLTQGVQQMSAANPFGGIITIGSGFRSPAEQARIVAYKPDGSSRLRAYGLDHDQYMADWERLKAQYGPGDKAAIELGLLWEDRLRAAGDLTQWVAPPGMSYHQKGMAADIKWNGKRLEDAPNNVREWIHANANRFGLHFPMDWEPWHVEVLGTRGTNGPAAGMVSVAAAGGGTTYIPRGSDLGMVGGVKPGGGYYQTFGTAHTGRGGADHRDYSQLYRVYSFQEMPGGIVVGHRNGRPVYAAPDYYRDDAGNYVSVAAEDAKDPAHSAVHIAQQNGWLIPTQSEINAVNARALNVQMPQGDGNAAEWGEGNSEYTRQVTERMTSSGWQPGMVVAHGKEIGMPDALAERTQGPQPPGPQMGPQWQPTNLPQGASPDKVGYIMQRLTGSSLGINPIMAAGIIGSLMGESGPQLGETLTNSIGAHGIAQWLGDRRTKLQAFAAGMHPPRTENDLDAQIDFLLHELQTTERGTLDALLQAKTPEDAAYIWTMKFERPEASGRKHNVRGGYARAVYGGGGTPVPGAYNAAPGTPPSTPYGLSAGAARLYNMPRDTPDAIAIRAAAMGQYAQEQAWIHTESNRRTSQLIDTLTVDMHNAPPGATFESIVSPEMQQQLGSQLTGMKQLWSQIQSGAYAPPNPDLKWEWDKKFIDAAKSKDYAGIISEWEDPSVQTYLRTHLSPSEMAELRENAKIAYAAKDDVDTVAGGGQSTGAAATAAAQSAKIPSDARMTDALTNRLVGKGLTQDEIDEILPQLKSALVSSLLQVSADIKGDAEGDQLLYANVDRLVSDVEVQTDVSRLTGRVKTSEGTLGYMLATIDREYEANGLTAADMVDSGIELEGVPVAPEILEMVYDGFVMHSPGGRAPKPSELLGLVSGFMFAEAPGGTAFQPSTMNPILGPRRRPAPLRQAAGTPLPGLLAPGEQPPEYFGPPMAPPEPIGSPLLTSPTLRGN